MSVVGVDFGVKNAVIAAAGRGGVDVILNGNSNRLNPCMVGFDKCRTFGEGASSTASSNYKNTIVGMKRLVGLTFNDPRAVKEMELTPLTFAPLKHTAGSDTIGVKVKYNDGESIISVEHAVGMMVKHLGMIAAENSLTKTNDSKATKESLFPSDWVIAIPGYYTDAQKRAFLSGCDVVGISGVLRLISETTASALAYGIFKDIRKEFDNLEKPSNVMFIDMGHSSYSVSIVSFEPGKLSVKTSHYDADLGGRDFDQIIANWVINEFETKYKNKLSSRVSEKPKTVLKIMAAAEKAKKTLSPAGVKEARINMECIMDDLDFAGKLLNDNYEAMCQPLLDRLAGPINRCLAETGLSSSDLTGVEIVGGATRVACLKKKLAGILGLNVNAPNMGLGTTMNADEAVARGAALQSAILSPRFKVKPYEIIEAQAYPIKISWDEEGQHGVEVEGEAEGNALPSSSVVMFDRGSNYPSVKRVTLRRSGEFSVVASYDESAAVPFPVGAPREIAILKIKAPPGAENKIRVNVKQDINGCTTLSSAQLVEEVIAETPVEPEAPPKDADMAGADKQADNGEEKKVVEETKEVPVPKKKIKKTNLEFSISRSIQWMKPEIDSAYEVEVSMSNADRIVQETSDMRNELESYIYDIRDKVSSYGSLFTYCSEEEKASLPSALETTENWLYEDGFDASKSVYAEKLGEIKKIGNPIEVRCSEATARPNAVSTLQRSVEKYKNFLNSCSSEEKYAHITVEEQQKCHDKCDDVSSWMYDMLDKQGALPVTADPVVAVSEINAKSLELANVVSPIMHKPIPKPKVEEKKPAEEKPAPEAKADDEEKKPEPMETVETPNGELPKDGEPMETDQ
mmetsp:Transcript_34036/g.39451  ORF Transcript_34036/g.39451 Transcript_34036/m.39451 type:complete len:856 (+) Transcript_34036:147-2714(+)